MTYLHDESIAAEQVVVEESIYLTIATPLYNIGKQVYNLSDDFKRDPMGEGIWSEAPAGLWRGFSACWMG